MLDDGGGRGCTLRSSTPPPASLRGPLVQGEAEAALLRARATAASLQVRFMIGGRRGGGGTAGRACKRACASLALRGPAPPSTQGHKRTPSTHTHALPHHCPALLALQAVGSAVSSSGGHDAVSLRLAEQYIAAFGRLAKAGNTLVLPANAGDAAGMVAQALAVFSTVRAGNTGSAAAGAASSAADAASDNYDDLLSSESPAPPEPSGAADRFGSVSSLGAGAAKFAPALDFGAAHEPASAAAPAPAAPSADFTPKPF